MSYDTECEECYGRTIVYLSDGIYGVCQSCRADDDPKAKYWAKEESKDWGGPMSHPPKPVVPKTKPGVLHECKISESDPQTKKASGLK